MTDMTLDGNWQDPTTRPTGAQARSAPAPVQGSVTEDTGGPSVRPIDTHDYDLRGAVGDILRLRGPVILPDTITWILEAVDEWQRK